MEYMKKIFVSGMVLVSCFFGELQAKEPVRDFDFVKKSKEKEVFTIPENYAGLKLCLTKETAYVFECDTKSNYSYFSGRKGYFEDDKPVKREDQYDYYKVYLDDGSVYFYPNYVGVENESFYDMIMNHGDIMADRRISVFRAKLGKPLIDGIEKKIQSVRIANYYDGRIDNSANYVEVTLSGGDKFDDVGLSQKLRFLEAIPEHHRKEVFQWLQFFVINYDDFSGEFKMRARRSRVILDTEVDYDPYKTIIGSQKIIYRRGLLKPMLEVSYCGANWLFSKEVKIKPTGQEVMTARVSKIKSETTDSRYCELSETGYVYDDGFVIDALSELAKNGGVVRLVGRDYYIEDEPTKDARFMFGNYVGLYKALSAFATTTSR
jgi:hypothetical protein